MNEIRLCLHFFLTTKLFPRQDNILNDSHKICNTPYAQFLEWGAKPEKIAIIKEMSDGQPVFQTAFDYFQETEKFDQIKFDVESLDRLTGGGIDVGSVTEFFGDAGSGKTQLCLQLALNCAVHLNGLTLYVSTDKMFPANRLAAMAKARQIDQTVLDTVYVWEFREVAKLKHFMANDLQKALRELPNVRLVIIDSIAGVFRYESNYIERARDMRETMQELNRLSKTYNFAIVCSNHITSVPGMFTDEVASLGPSWASLVTTKLKVERTTKLLDTEGPGTTSMRTLELIFSPRLPAGRESFAIDESGVVGVK